jgi:hypothetical protein
MSESMEPLDDAPLPAELRLLERTRVVAAVVVVAPRLVPKALMVRDDPLEPPFESSALPRRGRRLSCVERRNGRMKVKLLPLLPSSTLDSTRSCPSMFL